MQLSIDGEGHLSYVELTDEQVRYLQTVADDHIDDVETLAGAARWAIELSRKVWQSDGEYFGPSS